MSYEEADNLASNVGRGLRVLGQEPNKPLCIFADTRAEWMVSAQVTNQNIVSRHSDQSQHSIQYSLCCTQACFKQSFPIVTLYTNLGEEAVTHGINEAEVATS